jgi:acyl carrier protein
VPQTHARAQSEQYLNDESDFSEDLGLDLIEVIELTILLEGEFAGGRLTGEADEIELVGDLVRHIERANDGWIGVAGSAVRTASNLPFSIITLRWKVGFADLPASPESRTPVLRSPDCACAIRGQ